MVATIVLWVYQFLVCYIIGFAAAKGLLRVLGIEGGKLSPPILAVLGLGFVSIYFSTLNLFLPLGGFSSLLLFMVAAVLVFVTRPPIEFLVPRNFSLPSILVVLFTVTILELATHRPSVSDTALYHAQTIRWFETFPVVPGLGNLHHRLAFNSSWLVLNAGFSFFFLGFGSFHLVGPFLLLTCTWYFMKGVGDLFQKGVSWSAITRVLSIPLSFHLFSSEVSSPAYDMPVSLLIFMVVNLWVEMLEEGSESQPKVLAIFLISCFMVTIKLSALPILGFPLLIWINHNVRAARRTIWVWLGLAMLFVVPWVIRSIILSGYLVFPVSGIDLFAIDWKVSTGQAEAARNGIVGFARLPGRDWQSALSMPFSQWVPVWFGNLTFNQRSIFILALILPLVTLVSGTAARISHPGRYWIGLCILYSGVLFWFLSAPDIRFGYGFLAGVSMYAMAPLLDFVLRKIDSRKGIAAGLIVPLLILFQGYTLVNAMDLSTLRARILLPMDYSKSRAEACDIRNATVFCRLSGGQCNYDSFPCIPSPKPEVEMRGSTFRDGFRLMDPAPDSDNPSVP